MRHAKLVGVNNGDPVMDENQLREWIPVWASRYPGIEAEDQLLAAHAGRECLDRAGMGEVVDWKFCTHAYLRTMTRNALDREPDGRIEDVTRRAFACDDDLHALDVISELSQVGPAVGSTILMFNDPDRYTVIDQMALLSLRALGLFPEGPGDARREDWVAYLAACRSLRDITGQNLRTVDRALWGARGALD